MFVRKTEGRLDMTETVKFDLMGFRRLVFDDEAVTYITTEMYPIPLPGHLAASSVVTNVPIRYRDIGWVGLIRRRQWWAFAFGVLFAPLGIFWMAQSLGNWGEFIGCTLFLLLFGVFPFWLFISGRSFVAISSHQQTICFPSDRKKKQVRRALELLRNRLDLNNVQWRIDAPDENWYKSADDNSLDAS